MSLFRVEVDQFGNQTDIPQFACKDSSGNVLVLDLGQPLPDGYFEFIPDGRPPYAQALAQLNAQYQSDVDALNRAFTLAYLSDGASQDAKQASIRGQFSTLKTQYSANLAALRSEYGV